MISSMGKLIVIEGLDGSGKATQAKLLYEALLSEGERVRQVSFPDYHSPSSALVKMYLAGEFGSHPDDVNAYAASSFYAVDRFASFKKNWREDYEKGVVIADRYTTSNAIHQCSKLPRAQWEGYLDWLFEVDNLYDIRPCTAKMRLQHGM
jgi:dTMP kinase